MIEIDELLAFITVAEAGSFSQAAERLYLTQPAVSKRVAQLEDKFSGRLFDRIGRQIKLTEAGEILLPQAREIIQSVRKARQSIQDLSGQVQGSFRLATSHHVGLHRLPKVLKAYTSQYPDVTLELNFLDSEQACDAVTRGEFEVAVVTLPDSGHDALEKIAIWRDPLHVVAAPNHPLADCHGITLNRLMKHRAILPAANTYTRRAIEQQIGGDKLSAGGNLTSNYLETIKMMVSIGLGWSVLPESMIDREIQALDVKGVSFERTLGIVHHKQHTLSNAARSFVELMRESKGK